MIVTAVVYVDYQDIDLIGYDLSDINYAFFVNIWQQNPQAHYSL